MTPAAAPPAPAAAPEAIPARDPRADLRITFASVGDMMIGTDYPRNTLPDDDAERFLEQVSPIISAADIAFGNLEGVLLDGGEPGKKCSNPNACYLFRSPSRYAQRYADAGFDVLSLANNHARDFGEEGRTASMQHLAAAGIAHSGRVGDYASLEHEGLRIGVIAFAVTKNSNMMLDLALAEATVRDLAANYDMLLVSFHGGAEGSDATRLPFADEEYYGEPRGDVVRFARTMVDAGADLVIGHGPHVIRAAELYRDRLIAYSLGNFATYYGISVTGIKGIAPILETTLDGTGRFVSGRVYSTVQQRPAGPRLDQEQRALRMLGELSVQDFGNPGLRFEANGDITPIERESPPPYWRDTETGVP
jgi:poly-gamma-glutamate capsule biosynthesis protein CapA/YwtB (metallophosphatase superfamily)